MQSTRLGYVRAASPTAQLCRCAATNLYCSDEHRASHRQHARRKLLLPASGFSAAMPDSDFRQSESTRATGKSVPARGEERIGSVPCHPEFGCGVNAEFGRGAGTPHALRAHSATHRESRTHRSVTHREAGLSARRRVEADRVRQLGPVQVSPYFTS